MSNHWHLIRKIILSAIGFVLVLLAGISFYTSRYLREPVVLSPDIKEVKNLSDYFAGIKDSINDSNVYVFEGEEFGGSILILGGTHPEEPAGRLTAWKTESQ